MRNVSGYVCNHSSLPENGNETLRPLSRVALGTPPGYLTGYLKHDYKHPMHLTLAGGHL